MVSRTHPTVPSPPQHITLKFGTSLNILKPCMGPPVARLWTCLGFKIYWNLRRILPPCLPPDFGFINTKRGQVFWAGVIWKDIAGCLAADDEYEVCKLVSWIRNQILRNQLHKEIKCTKKYLLTLSLPYLEPRFWSDFCLSKTTGQIEVGGRTCTACSPREHSALTEETHLLCS